MPDTVRADYGRLLDHLRKTATLRSCISVLDWDRDVNLPPGGGELRARQLELLAGLVHARQCAPELGDLLGRAQEHADAEGADSDAAANVREARRAHEHALRVPRALVEETARVTTLARLAWGEARDAADFARFLPWLGKVFDLARREAEALGWRADPYDPLADKYEPGEDAASFARSSSPCAPRPGTSWSGSSARGARSTPPCSAAPIRSRRSGSSCGRAWRRWASTSHAGAST